MIKPDYHRDSAKINNPSDITNIFKCFLSQSVISCFLKQEIILNRI